VGVSRFLRAQQGNCCREWFEDPRRGLPPPLVLSLVPAHSLRLLMYLCLSGEGSFGRVWSATWRASQVAVKEFVFAQAALSGNTSDKEVGHPP
jgi:hypothetical protein